VEIVVTGRHTQISDRFRAHIHDKLSKVPQLAPRVMRVDVVVSHEPNRRQAKACERVEITCRVKGPVVRAEACSDDKYAALDGAMEKLMERLRRAQDRRRIHRGRHVPESVAQATARFEAPLNGDSAEHALPSSDAAEARGTGPAPARASSPGHVHTHPSTGFEHEEGEDLFGARGDSPIEVREKVHATLPMTLEDAVREMELVGHDFFLFHDADTDRPSVVYRRRGWSYGVIHLDVEREPALAGPSR
jgi:ribosomal subunit interface protein